jgi:alpha-D-ribose 1-methylphosphonate 5-triphosphate synthase subunit PhnG
MSAPRFGRARRCELLALADRQTVLTLADTCTVDTGPPTEVRPVEVGTVLLTVREPVELLRCHLADVLVTRAEVRHRDTAGWSMVLGNDVGRAMAIAVLDAEAEAGGPWADAVVSICVEAEAAAVRRRDDEWSELAPTVVSFEEITA